MVQIIRNGGIGAIFLGLFLLLITRLSFNIVPDFPQVTFTPLFRDLHNSLQHNRILNVTLGLSFIVLQASLFSFILNYHHLTKERSLFPFILYVMFACVYSEQFYLNPASFLNFFLLLIIERLLRLQDIGKDPGTLFLDIGTIVGISMLFSKEAVFYIPFIIIGVIIIYTSNISNLLIILLSSIMVFVISGGIYFMMGKFRDFETFFTFNSFELGINFSHWQERFYIVFFTFFALSVISYLYYLFSNVQISNKSKRFTAIFILFWFVSLTLVVFQKLNLWFNTALMVIPMALFASIFFQDKKGNDWFKNLLFFIILVAIVSAQLNY
ncbi:MAG: hypothetical protein H6605_07915 [Flavobacteriales bacterium]|nr:hypothetical protein [Flavobacteriales bacterium]